MPGEPSQKAAVNQSQTHGYGEGEPDLSADGAVGNSEAGFRLSSNPIDATLLASAMSDDRAGACVTFEGRVRNSNEERAVTELEYEAYARMALKEGARVLAEARQRFEIIDARCIHRLGCLRIGEVAVWIGVLSGHREEGFAACRYIIDEVKARVPIWKKEHYREGDTSWVGGSAETDETG